MSTKQSILQVSIIAILVTGFISTLSVFTFDRTEKASLYLTVSDVQEENARLISEEEQARRQSDILIDYVNRLYNDGVIPRSDPTVVVTPEPAPSPTDTPTGIYVPVLIPTLPPIEFDFATATPGTPPVEATVTPFRG